MIIHRSMLLVGLLFFGCHSNLQKEEADLLKKIGFDLAKINDAGLRGPADGLVSVSYEFCIPAQTSLFEEVKKLDPSLEKMASRGRIGCKPGTWLCIGHTAPLPDWRKRLLNIARLTFVERIEETFYE